MPVAKKPVDAESNYIDVPLIDKKLMTIDLIGTTPIIFNRMSEKARQQLLMPPPKMNAAEKSANLKHKPFEEYVASCHRVPEGPTLLAMPSTAFKGAICDAALDLPGTRKAQIGRLVYIPGEFVAVWGVPEIYSTIVRSADMNRTPDVRTRAIVRHWCARVQVRYVSPILKGQGIMNLMVAAGICIGIGDFRQQKGAGNNGAFEVVADDEQRAEFDRLVKEAGRKAQDTALAHPRFYNEETAELLSWYGVEAKRRGFHVVGQEPQAVEAAAAPAKRGRKAA